MEAASGTDGVIWGWGVMGKWTRFWGMRELFSIVIICLLEMKRTAFTYRGLIYITELLGCDSSLPPPLSLPSPLTCEFETAIMYKMDWFGLDGFCLMILVVSIFRNWRDQRLKRGESDLALFLTQVRLLCFFCLLVFFSCSFFFWFFSVFSQISSIVSLTLLLFA